AEVGPTDEKSAARRDYTAMRYGQEVGARREEAGGKNFSLLPPASSLLLRRRRLHRRSASQLSIHVEQRCRVVADQLELRDDFAACLFLLDLFGEDPLQLGDRRERLLLKCGLVERVDLTADRLLLLERALEDVGQRLERLPRFLERFQRDLGI